MTDEQIRALLERYDLVMAARPDPAFRYIERVIVPEMRIGLEAGGDRRREAVQHDLGFIQAVLWLRGVYTLEELQSHKESPP